MEEKRDEQQLEAEKFRVTQQLQRHGIDVSVWGQGEAKTVNHLVSEVLSGESQLIETDNGEIIRILEVVSGTIRYSDESGRVFELAEDRQEFKDGRVRRRKHLSGISISEKMGSGENPRDALIRGIREELGITEELNIDEQPVESEEEVMSPSFPGLNTKYKKYHFGITIGKDSYNSTGYREEQADKSTFFVWNEIKE